MRRGGGRPRGSEQKAAPRSVRLQKPASEPARSELGLGGEGQTKRGSKVSRQEASRRIGGVNEALGQRLGECNPYN